MRGYTRLTWSCDLKDLQVSLWVSKTWKYAYLYEHKSGARHVAKTHEEQAAIHRLYGLPPVDPLDDFAEGARKMLTGTQSC